jgi:hypothetical protein
VKVAGPAPDPLPWFKVSLSEDGYLMVDKTTKLEKPEWLRV